MNLRVGFEQHLIYALRGALKAGLSLRDAEAACGVSFKPIENAAERIVEGTLLVEPILKAGEQEK